MCLLGVYVSVGCVYVYVGCVYVSVGCVYVSVGCVYVSVGCVYVSVGCVYVSVGCVHVCFNRALLVIVLTCMHFLWLNQAMTLCYVSISIHFTILPACIRACPLFMLWCCSYVC